MSARRILGTVCLFLLMPIAVFAQPEAEVRAAFAATPVMIEIARCESKFTQYGPDGSALRGGLGKKMIGVFQVYETIHAEEAAKLGMDIYTLEGNLAYAKYLFEHQGTTPWLSSFPCWGKEVDVPTDAANESQVISVGLSVGMMHPHVLLLQRILNEKGYLVASEGPGSAGNETEKFGSLTRDAVRRFQCAEKIACEGDEYTTGYGFVGAKTRAALASRTVAPPPGVPSPDPSEVSSHTIEEQKKIAELQKQIAELTKILAGLVALRAN